jgi:hypothetical protein
MFRNRESGGFRALKALGMAEVKRAKKEFEIPCSVASRLPGDVNERW